MGLDTVELVMDAEAHFAVKVPDQRAQHIETVGQFAELITELRAQAGHQLPFALVLQQLQERIHRRFAIPLATIRPEARFVKDLGLDQ